MKHLLKEKSMSTKNNQVKVGALMLLAGGIIGAGLALLYAPQSGKRTRSDIVRLSRKGKEQAVDALEEFTELVNEMVDSVSDKAAELFDKGKDMATSAKQDVLKAISKGQARLDTEKSRLSKQIN
jgi:gas vesicle protein